MICWPKHQDHWVCPRSPACTSGTTSSNRSAHTPRQSDPRARHRLSWLRGARHRKPRHPLPAFSSNGDTGSASAWPATQPPSVRTSCHWRSAPILRASISQLWFTSSANRPLRGRAQFNTESHCPRHHVLPPRIHMVTFLSTPAQPWQYTWSCRQYETCTAPRWAST